MRIGLLKSIGHNIADSLASGIGMAIGVYQMDVFGEASAGPQGYVIVDFLRRTTSGADLSEDLRNAIGLYREYLPRLCERHGVPFANLKALEARFGTDPVYGRHFTVTVEGSDGKRSTDRYFGVPGKRLRLRRK
jgi:hypothetical protein